MNYIIAMERKEIWQSWRKGISRTVEQEGRAVGPGLR